MFHGGAGITHWILQTAALFPHNHLELPLCNCTDNKVHKVHALWWTKLDIMQKFMSHLAVLMVLCFEKKSHLMTDHSRTLCIFIPASATLKIAERIHDQINRFANIFTKQSQSLSLHVPVIHISGRQHLAVVWCGVCMGHAKMPGWS